MTRDRITILTLGIVLGFFVVMALLSQGGYPGPGDLCVRLDCYCEAARSGLAAQPANAWSNLGFVVVGLIVLRDATRIRPGGSLMRDDRRFPYLFGAIGVFLGLGSFALHGALRLWGAFLDVESMMTFVAFFLAYDVTRITAGGWRRFLGWFLGVFALLTALVVAAPQEHARTIFGVVVGITLIVEASVSYPRMRPRWPRPIAANRTPWFWVGLAAFATAFAIWLPSRDGGPLCDPNSLLQGHAIWHVLSAVSVWCFYRYLRDEAVVADVSAAG